MIFTFKLSELVAGNYEGSRELRISPLLGYKTIHSVFLCDNK